MRIKPYITWVILAGLLLAPVRAVRAQAYVQAVSDFDALVREYNVITFGNATFTNYGDTWGPVAVGGNLTLNGGAVAIHSDVSTVSNDPTLYVNGQLTVTGDVQLNNGYASLPNDTGSWTWNSTQKVLTSTTTGGKLYSINSSNPLAANDPRTNAGPTGWNWASIQSQATTLSATLAAAAQTGTIAVNGSQTLTFVSTTTADGVVVFQLDASLLGNGTYNGQAFSNLSFSIGANQTAVVNVINAAGKTLFGSGVNFNDPGIADRLLWNITGSGSVSLGNGGQFYGSVLAPLVSLSNANNTSINGQIIAGSLSYSNAELHDTAFTPVGLGVLVPEPSTYALWGAALCAAGFVLRRKLRPTRR